MLYFTSNCVAIHLQLRCVAGRSPRCSPRFTSRARRPPTTHRASPSGAPLPHPPASGTAACGISPQPTARWTRRAIPQRPWRRRPERGRRFSRSAGWTTTRRTYVAKRQPFPSLLRDRKLAKRLVFPFRRSFPAHSRLLVRVTAAGQPADGPVPERRGRGAGVRPAGAVGRRRHHRLGRLGGHLQQHAVQRTEVARAQAQPVVSLTTHDYRHSI